MKNNSFVVGIFVIIAMSLGVCAILLLGAKDAFIEKQQCVLYFDGDMSGLGPGSRVVFKGVKIGEVKDVRIMVNDALETSVPVFIELDTSNIKDTQGGSLVSNDGSRLNHFLKRGFCAQLVTESFVTGKLMIEFDFQPNKKTALHGHDGPEMELPTVPNEFDMIKESLAELPIKSLVTSLVNSLEGIDKRVNSIEVTESLKFLSSSLKNLESLLMHGDDTVVNFQKNSDQAFASADVLLQNMNASILKLTKSVDTTLVGVQKLTGNLDVQVGSMGKEVKSMTGSADKAIKEVEVTLAEYRKLADPDSPVYSGLVEALTNFSRASKSITALTDYLNRHPEALLHGKQGD